MDSNESIKISGCSGNNLKDVDLKLPLGKLICVTGVSGSGKSTLINQTLYPAINNNLNKSNHPTKPFKKIEGLSSELKIKLSQVNPQHIHEASKIDGMTPSGLMLLISKINSYKKTA